MHTSATRSNTTTTSVNSRRAQPRSPRDTTRQPVFETMSAGLLPRQVRLARTDRSDSWTPQLCAFTLFRP